MAVVCTHCGYVVETVPGNKKILETIQDWIRFSLRVQQGKGASAKTFGDASVPCPQCGRHDGWQDQQAASAAATPMV